MKLPFDWYDSNLPAECGKTTPAKIDEMYRKEIEKKSTLFKDLGYSKEYAKNRIKNNFAWEFELSVLPSVVSEIDAIVDKIFG